MLLAVGNKYKKISYKQIADEFNKPEYAVLSGENAIRIFGDKVEAEKFLNEYYQDAIFHLFKVENHQFIFDNLFTEHSYKYDLTKNPVN